MTADDKTHLDKLRNEQQHPKKSHKVLGFDEDLAEDSCAAFGYLRGIRERADAMEVRFKNGSSTWLPYNWLGTWKFDPSRGLLLKFTGDVTYLVLVEGSNLDSPLLKTTTNLTTSGLQRHRIVWIREMSDEEIERVGESGPTIDSIQVVELESNAEVIKWLEKHAPTFLPAR